MHHLWIHISWWPLCWQLFWKGKQIILLQKGGGGGPQNPSLHLLILVFKIFIFLHRSQVFVEPDEKKVHGTHFLYTNLIAALMGISEEVRRREMSYDLGGLSQLNFKHTIPLISIEVGQERFTRQPGSERAEAWRSWLLQNSPFTSVLEFNSRSCGVLHILPGKTRGQVMHCPITLSNSARYKNLQKGPWSQLLWIREAPLFSGELCRLALMEISPNAVLSRMYLFGV